MVGIQRPKGIGFMAGLLILMGVYGAYQSATGELMKGAVFSESAYQEAVRKYRQQIEQINTDVERSFEVSQSGLQYKLPGEDNQVLDVPEEMKRFLDALMHVLNESILLLEEPRSRKGFMVFGLMSLCVGLLLFIGGVLVFFRKKPACHVVYSGIGIDLVYIASSFFVLMIHEKILPPDLLAAVSRLREANPLFFNSIMMAVIAFYSVWLLLNLFILWFFSREKIRAYLER